MKIPSISIIIPSYNRANLILDTLESVQNQTFTNWECIIIDDGSTDDSLNTIQNYIKDDTRFQLHSRPANMPKGANTCRNFGFELSNAAMVNWFDSDDVMLPNCLYEVSLLANKSFNIIIAALYKTDENLTQRKHQNLTIQSSLYKDYILWDFRITTGSVFFKRQFLESKELFNPLIKRGQETELFSRLFFKIDERSYAIINKPLFLYRQHEESKTTKNEAYIRDYKESQSYIFLQVLKQSILLKDDELIHDTYQKLLGLFYKSVKYKHFKNSKYIVIGLVKTLGKSKISLLVRFICIDLLVAPVVKHIKFKLSK